jgi:glycogen debranching enzyme
MSLSLSEDTLDAGYVTNTSADRTLKHDDSFVVLDASGDMGTRGHSEQGAYFRGTRHLSKLVLRVQNLAPITLNSSLTKNNLVLTAHQTNRAPNEGTLPEGAVHIKRDALVINSRLVQQIEFTNYSQAAVTFTATLHFGADFVDVFEVRGAKRSERGELHAPQVSPESVRLEYQGLDRVLRRTTLTFSPLPKRVGERQVEFEVALEPHRTARIELAVVFQSSEVGLDDVVAGTYSDAREAVLRRAEGVQANYAQFDSDHKALGDWLSASLSDLALLTTDMELGPYPYAGIPWFSTPFGRDALIVALQTLWVCPGMARGVLRTLAAHQATEFDAANDAEPGKILHEMRLGEMPALREVPFGKYYGSVDSTPLFLLLVAEYYKSTGDVSLVRTLWPNVLAAMDWITTSGDRDGDGFIEYDRRSKQGLVQQGWKDSQDSVFHKDGVLADAPIALCEVQGYHYAALVGLAEVAQLLGHNTLAQQWRNRAETLRAAFDESFWCEELGTYALALDRDKRPCKVAASNAAHCLYTGIALESRAKSITDHLLSPRMFSGWGIRTLSTEEVRYNPLAYHNGSVWPHDTAIAAAGMARYGFQHQSATIFTALLDVASATPNRRLPELFCGFPRSGFEAPVPYPMACSPQAWAAGASLMALQACLRLEVNALKKEIRCVSPVLPPGVHELTIRGLWVGSQRTDLTFARDNEGVRVRLLQPERSELRLRFQSAG